MSEAGAAADKMPSEQSVLLSAVRELTRAVRALEKTIKEDYPKREEIERKYSTKQDLKRRRVQLVSVLMAAIIGSYFSAVETIDYCFVRGATPDKTFCRIFPGYKDAAAENQKLISVFLRNSARLDTLEKQVGELKK